MQGWFFAYRPKKYMGHMFLKDVKLALQNQFIKRPKWLDGAVIYPPLEPPPHKAKRHIPINKYPEIPIRKQFLKDHPEERFRLPRQFATDVKWFKTTADAFAAYKLNLMREGHKNKKAHEMAEAEFSNRKMVLQMEADLAFKQSVMAGKPVISDEQKLKEHLEKIQYFQKIGDDQKFREGLSRLENLIEDKKRRKVETQFEEEELFTVTPEIVKDHIRRNPEDAKYFKNVFKDLEAEFDQFEEPLKEIAMPINVDEMWQVVKDAKRIRRIAKEKQDKATYMAGTLQEDDGSSKKTPTLTKRDILADYYDKEWAKAPENYPDIVGPEVDQYYDEEDERRI